MLKEEVEIDILRIVRTFGVMENIFLRSGDRNRNRKNNTTIRKKIYR
jgi:hypothetical protein